MEGELIFLGFIMLIGQIILLQMYMANWFKKENFKIDKSNVMATNKLQLRKLEMEMGLTPSKKLIPTESPSTLEGLTNLLPLLKGLDPEQIGALADRFLGGGADVAEGPVGITDMLMDYATENPEIVKGLLEGLSAKKEQETVPRQEL